jgi:hypothetical protein
MGKAHLLAEPGSVIPISWAVTEPDITGTCRIAIADEGESIFTSIQPVDGSGDGEGWFSCCRTQGVDETTRIVLPSYF